MGVTAYIFAGPVVYDYRPLEKAYPHLLTIGIPYGKTVWQDASGVWHEKFAPGIDDLDGALHVYSGGRDHQLTDAERTALIAGGYGDYIATVTLPDPNPPWPTPTYPAAPPSTFTPPAPDPAWTPPAGTAFAVVGEAEVGGSVLG